MSVPSRILILGVGSIGERHLRCFQTTGRCQVAFCEPNEDRRNEIAAKYGVTGYDSWESALEEETFSAAVIAAHKAAFPPPTMTIDSSKFVSAEISIGRSLLQQHKYDN